MKYDIREIKNIRWHIAVSVKIEIKYLTMSRRTYMYNFELTRYNFIEVKIISDQN
jgi:hypothetical protein